MLNISFRFVRAPPVRSGNSLASQDEQGLDSRAVLFHLDNATSSVVFRPDVRRQRELARGLGTDEDEGFAGQFVVQYDVVRDNPGGEVRGRRKEK